MLYHVSVALDYSEHDLVVGKIEHQPPLQENNVSDTLPLIENEHSVALTETDIKKREDSKANMMLSNDVANVNFADTGKRGNIYECQETINKNNYEAGSEAYKENNKITRDAYEVLSFSTESMPMWHDQQSSVHPDSPTASSEYAVSSPSITSSLSRSTSSFSADSSSIGVSESTSLEGIYFRHKQECVDSTSEKLIGEEDDDNLRPEQFECTYNGNSKDIETSDISNPNWESDKSGNDGDIDSSSTTNNGGQSSGSSDLSDDASSPPTIRQILNTIPETSEAISSSSSSSPQILMKPDSSTSNYATLKSWEKDTETPCTNNDNSSIFTEVSSTSSGSLITTDCISSSKETQLHQRNKVTTNDLLTSGSGGRTSGTGSSLSPSDTSGVSLAQDSNINFDVSCSSEQDKDDTFSDKPHKE